jgi:hypothetical protein
MNWKEAKLNAQAKTTWSCPILLLILLEKAKSKMGCWKRALYWNGRMDGEEPPILYPNKLEAKWPHKPGNVHRLPFHILFILILAMASKNQWEWINGNDQTFRPKFGIGQLLSQVWNLSKFLGQWEGMLNAYGYHF